MDFINAFRHNASADGHRGKILVHCFQGISRAATICLAYMVQFLGYSVDQALYLVRQCRPQASPNYTFMKSLRVLEDRCKKCTCT